MNQKLQSFPARGRRYVDYARFTGCCRLTGSWYRLFQRPPIHRIPAEIFTEIFMLVRDSLIDSSAPTSRDIDQLHAANLALFRITAVCFHWRLVATGFGALWSNIVFSTLKSSSIQCAKLFLGRTKRSALCVYVSAPVLPDTPTNLATIDKLVSDISRESDRVRIFHFSATSWSNDLYMYWMDPVETSHQLPGNTSVKSAALCRPFPQLESMSLSSPIWYPNIAPRLKDLELRNNGGTASLKLLLCNLGQCPELGSLVLQGYRQFVDEDHSRVVTILPKLYRLHLFSCTPALILASLHLPSLTHPLIISDSDPHENILCNLPWQHGARYLEGVSKLRVVFDAGNSRYSLSAYREDGRMTLYLTSSAVSHLSRFRWIHESIEAITSFGPFSQAMSLSVTADVVCSSWSSWLLKMRHVSRLDLCCADVTGYLTSLSTLVDGSPLCPSLSTLALDGFSSSGAFSYALLKACILFRRAVGCPLTFVIIPGSDLTRVCANDPSWNSLIDSQGERTYVLNGVQNHTLTKVQPPLGRGFYFGFPREGSWA